MQRVPSTDPDWLDQAVESLRFLGCAIVEDVVPPDLLDRSRDAMYEVQARIRAEIGEERLERAGELGVLRLMLRYDPLFVEFLELPEVLAVVDATVSATAILHLQNGLVLPPAGATAPDVFQLRFHRDFPRELNGFVASINTFFAIDEFTAENGGTILVPGTHQKDPAPTEEFMANAQISAECPPGSMIVFDSTLLHAAGLNRSGQDRMAINQQFTRSWIKQQVDYVRALGDDFIASQQPRTQQLLGWYTRTVTSLDEYYRPPEERLYRGGQG
jgi:ectoine hydroxylase-related dioxygenase (phytanoyl-CoA dioxygenase family)